MATLIPTSGAVIIDTMMSNYTSATISTDLDSPVWSWELIPVDGAPIFDDIIDINFTVTDVGVVAINYIDSVNLYPIKSMSYMKSNYDDVTITSLSQLPTDPLESPFIYDYKVSNKAYTEWRLNVTVDGTETTTVDSGGGGNGGGGSTTVVTPITLTGNYSIRINTDYGEHANILRRLLDERSNY